ncbi:MAG: type III-A CRISPR-associated RAMP protein Csm3 [Halarcobacter sp.]
MKILKLVGELEVLTGLHIGAGDDVMKIGGVSNSVIKDINTDKPYVPGSSIKGKMRSLLEWHFGLVNVGRDDKEKGKPFSSKYFSDVVFEKEGKKEKAVNLIKLFGDANSEEKRENYGVTRLSFSDCSLIEQKDIKNLTESKYENVIDRTNGTAKHPRQTERVCRGVKFNYIISLKIIEDKPFDDEQDKLKDIVKKGLELIEDDYLGGNGTRGYGRVSFSNKDKWE